MASGTQTVLAGLHPLDSLYKGDSLLQGTFIYVPKLSVGMRRVSLIVLLHGSAMDGREMITWDDGMFTKFADSTGIILVAPTSHSSDGGWGNIRDTKPRNVDGPIIDAAIRQVLRHYAIDPTKIALVGASAGAGAVLDFGIVNGDVFNCVVAFSGFSPFFREHEFDGLKRHGRPAIYIGINTGEAKALRMPVFVSWLRNAGYQVSYLEDHGPHSLPPERATPAFNWLIALFKP